VHLVGFIVKKFVTKHCHRNVLKKKYDLFLHPISRPCLKDSILIAIQPKSKYGLHANAILLFYILQRLNFIQFYILQRSITMHQSRTIK
jgi:hypothetical protein